MVPLLRDDVQLSVDEYRNKLYSMMDEKHRKHKNMYIYISILYRDKRLLLYSLNSMIMGYVSTGLSPESGDYRSTSGRKQLVVIVIQLSVKATRLLVKILHTHIKIYVRREVEATHTSPLT